MTSSFLIACMVWFSVMSFLRAGALVTGSHDERAHQVARMVLFTCELLLLVWAVIAYVVKG